MQNEVFTFIQGYMYSYTISNYGRVFNGNKELKQSIVNGYKVVALRKVDGTFEQNKVHRLVAKAFLPNPNNLPQVNHKDEDKINNCADNLEWCTAYYNNHYGSRSERVKVSLLGHGFSEKTRKQIKDTVTQKQGRPVIQYDLFGNEINRFNSTKDAERATSIPHGKISAMCKGTWKSYKGSTFRYNTIIKEV